MTNIFTSNRKMADLIVECHKVILLLPRFGIEFGFGDKSVREVCASCSVDEQLFLVVCNIYAHSDYLPENECIESLPLNQLIQYLRLSHHYYRSQRLPHIEQHLHHLADGCTAKTGRVLRRFFYDYKEEVVKQFCYEEQIVYPYAELLLKRQGNKDFSIHQYEEHHSNIEDKLDDLKNIIIKYLPGNSLPEERTSMLFDLFQLSADLRLHNKIEEQLLVPMVKQLEQNGI
ncbi:MAG: hemerythrin domain-containing protein [Bacteroidaceae bacterium]